MKMRSVKKRLARNGFTMFKMVAPNGDIRYGFGDEEQAFVCPTPRREFLAFLKKAPYYIK